MLISGIGALARWQTTLYTASMAVVATLTSEQLEALGEEIAAFSTRIDVAEHALLTRLRTFDAHEAWGN
jgi:hypothetical protein